jgi:rhodanese-related sulfurtransferase
MADPQITGDTKMGVIMDLLPGGKRALFARYHLGGCSSCAFSNDETLAELCARSGPLSVDEVIAHLLDSHQHDLEMLMAPEKARDRLSSTTPPRMIDIRTREEFEAVAVPGSEFFTQELQQSLFASDPSTVVLLIDHSGRNVLDMVAWLRGHGMKETYGITGGIDAWSREVDPSLPRYRVEME